MTLYRVYRVLNEEDIFTKISENKDRIFHPRLSDFYMTNMGKFIQCNGRDSLELPFSTEESVVFGEVNIGILIARYHISYCIVGVSGIGLFSVRGIPKYINEEILSYVKEHLRNRYEINDIVFEAFEYENDSFSTKFWGEGITTKFGYNSKNKMYIRISGVDLINLLKKKLDLEGYYSSGTIKSIKGKIPELEYSLDGKKIPGYFTFSRDGITKCEPFDLVFFNNFVKILIDKEFYGRW